MIGFCTFGGRGVGTRLSRIVPREPAAARAALPTVKTLAATAPDPGTPGPAAPMSVQGASRWKAARPTALLDSVVEAWAGVPGQALLGAAATCPRAGRLALTAPPAAAAHADPPSAALDETPNGALQSAMRHQTVSHSPAGRR